MRNCQRIGLRGKPAHSRLITEGWMWLATMFALAAFTWCPAARAQITTGDILGTVTDQTGAVIPGAKVTLRNLGTGVKATTQSNQTGDYLFTLLIPGQYSVFIEAAGFKKVQFASVSLAAGDRLREDGKMQPGAVDETVEVSAAPPLLQTDSAAVTSVVTEKSVQDLPLNGRNFINLAEIQPGINEGPPNAVSSGTRPDDRRMTSTLSANGQSDLFNNEMIDGMDNNEREQGFLGVRPSIDDIAEVKVDTNAFSAESGRDAGAVVNLITKSGTNQYHGSAYEFFRNDIFDANSYSFGANVPKNEYRQNQFGGSVGGPIAKDKTFFFGDVEDDRIVQQQPSTLFTVPTAQEHPQNGFVDFSDNGGARLPTSMLSPVGLAYLAMYPLPNTGPAGATFNNYIAQPKETQDALSLDGRIDQHFKNGDSLFGRYSYNNVDTNIAGAFPAVNVAGMLIQPGGNTFGFAGPSITKAHNVMFDYVHTYNPNLVMELKAGYTRIDIVTDSLNNGKNASSAIGLVDANTPAAPQTTGLMPLIFLADGYAGVGDSPFLPILDRNNTFQYMGGLTYTHGNHIIKAGGLFLRRQLNYYQSSFPLGWTFFAGLTGNAMQDLLMGLPLGYMRGNTLIEPGYRIPEFGTYVQDDWRATRTLTLNIGLRYDVYGAITEAHNRYSNFDYPTLTLISGTQSPHVGIDTNFKNFQPRIGFSQSLGKSTVVRGGFGISSYPIAIQSEIQIPNPPYDYSVSCIPCFGGGFVWPTIPNPTPASTTNLSGSLTYNPHNFNTLYIEQFNLMVQREIGGNVLTIGGLGELGRHLLTQPSINEPLPAGPYVNDATQGPSPAPGWLTASQLPNVGPIEVDGNWATNNYYALQAVYARRFTKGLAFNANYTWGRGLGDAVAGSGGGTALGMIPTNVRADYGNSGVDIRHRFAGNWSYVLPFGQNASGARGLLTKGWQTNFIMFWQTGQPFGITDSYTNSNGLAQINIPNITSDRPNLVPHKSYTTPGKGLQNWLDPTAFTPQPAGTLGNEGNNPFHGPHTRRADMSVFKDFNVTEKLQAQFRAECFNISNTPNFLNPGAGISQWNPGPEHDASHPIKCASGASGCTSVGLLPGDIGTNAAGFGSVTSTVPNVNPRQFQFAMKLLF